VCLSASMPVCFCLSLSWCPCLFSCLCLCFYLFYLCPCVVSMYLCVHVSVNDRVCQYMYLSCVCLRLCLCISVCLYLGVRVCFSTCVRFSIFLFRVHVWCGRTRVYVYPSTILCVDVCSCHLSFCVYLWLLSFPYTDFDCGVD